MATAFQSNAFQNNAFQIIISPVVRDTHDGANDHYIKKHRERLKKQAKLAEEAIYRNVHKENVLPIDVIEEKEAQERPILTLKEPPPSAYKMAKMPLADPMQWLLDDDEEAILWLLQ